jgi:hypothetical protein
MKKETEIRKHIREIVDDCQLSIEILSRLMDDRPKTYSFFVSSMINAILPYYNNPLVGLYIRRLLLVRKKVAILLLTIIHD